ncbi:hypothetical protein [Gordonia rubripertincta]|uniref:hypothetical protein n=1 Tax=Gordonia rubripertincta TaxID=36822 RepID=UPI000B8D870F|nr:hypothetical protein [Gordonia rubripertincta]ASR05637.1 hypothetical protein GCWB2_24330 [Gordonia rubripertincta]
MARQTPFSYFTARLTSGYTAPEGAALDLDTQIIATTTAARELDRIAEVWQDQDAEPNLVTLRDYANRLIVRTVTGSNVAVYAATPVTEPYPFGAELTTIYRHGFTMRLTARLGAISLDTRDCRPGRADRPHGLRRFEPSHHPAPNHTLITGHFAEDSRKAHDWLTENAERIAATDDDRETTAAPLIYG